MSKSFRYVDEFDFGYKCGGKVRGQKVEKVAVKRKDSPNAVVREKSATRMEKAEMKVPFNREPLIPMQAPAMKKGGSTSFGPRGKEKVSKVMGEYKAGELHSGSKKGPEVTSKKQAVAIALSEARKASKKK